jgi:hypothetical protein
MRHPCRSGAVSKEVHAASGSSYLVPLWDMRASPLERDSVKLRTEKKRVETGKVS